MEHGSPLRLADGNHVVHFYETVQSRVGLVTAYLAASLLEGDRVLVIAVGDRGSAVGAGLAAAGVDVERAVRGGTLTMLDADGMIREFMVEGIPSADRFDATVGSRVRRLGEAGRPVRVYGEMVARLWQEGNVPAAVRLEGLWNELADRTPFGLFCSYPLALTSDAAACEALGAVCDLHSHVVDGAPDPDAASVRRFVACPQAARLARRYVSDTLREWGYADRPDVEGDAIIAAGELVANAVRHGGRYFTVGLTRTPGGLRLMVSDSSRAAPKPAVPGLLGIGDRGLQMVETVATDWGYDLHSGGKVVWVELVTPLDELEEAVS